MLDSSDEMLTTMAGSFGYAAPEVMLKKGHGKAVDMWSLGVITYTLLCGYSPFRSESLADLIDECSHGRVVFHERYWKEVSKDAKRFIGDLLQPNPKNRPTSSVILPFHPCLKYMCRCLRLVANRLVYGYRKPLNTAGSRARLLLTTTFCQKSNLISPRRVSAAGSRWLSSRTGLKLSGCAMTT